MKRSYIIAVGIVVVILIGFFVFNRTKASSAADIIALVKKGEFRVEVETTGELEAKNSVKIMGPGSVRQFQIWEVTLQNIVDEGTVVKKGDWVATLDRSEFQTKFNQKQIDFEKANSKFVQIQLDTTLQMRQARDELINLKYGAEEKEIILQQSKFEPPATIKQAEINLDKAHRAYQQALENYKIKRNQNVEKMREVEAELRKVRGDFDGMSKILESFNVMAPEDGMVIYEKGWDGKPIKAGSRIGMWEPTVATLPDLTKMQSKTFVNEVDVRKVKPGQKVLIGLDSDPDKKFNGVVTKVANVGEQRPNSDAKVFEVLVEIDGTDATLRPSMTTSNKIIAQVLNNVIFIPLESLHTQNDSITYVFKKDGIKITKQEVVVAETNSNEAVITSGLSPDEKVFLSVPTGVENDEVKLLPERNGKRRKKDAKEVKVAPKDSTQVTKPSI
ncbi:MAG: efflux RND transporter periplasmic adaptor subunit [Cyclobacteriaceae bacterium]|jgi:HlyD family secretion protein|nr:HlyD family efflux transporter periplasmic adaptor subunit [Flammeovirgaceae bacterium]